MQESLTPLGVAPAPERPARAANWRRWTMGVLSVALVGSAVATFVGWQTWPLLVAAILPWLGVARARLGAVTGLPLVVVGALFAELAVLSIAPWMPLGLDVVHALAWAVIGAVGVLFSWFRMGEFWQAPSRSTVILGASSAFGALAWIIVLVGSAIRPFASKVAWAVQGDAANNLLSAFAILEHNGIVFGPLENPVPLPAGMLAAFIAQGRGSVAAEDVLTHDLQAFPQLLSILIILTSLVCGVTVASFVRGRPTLVASVASAGASLLPLSWFVTGQALEYGFLNTHLSIIIVLCCWLAFLRSSDHPTVTLAVQFMAGTTLLATWSPLVVVPIGFLVTMVVVDGRSILGLRGPRLITVLILGAQMLAFGLFVAWPSFRAVGAAFAGIGAVARFPPSLFILLASSALLLAIPHIRHRPRRVFASVLTLVVALATATGALLLARGGQGDPWGYYPLKLLWLSAVVLLVVVVALSAWHLSRARSTVRALAILLVYSVVVGSFISLAQSAIRIETPSFDTDEPIIKVLRGQYEDPSDKTLARVARLSSADHHSLLWQSGDLSEGGLNFWLIQLAAGRLAGEDELRTYAYGYEADDVQELCDITVAMGGTIVVYTANTDLAAEFGRICDDSAVTFEPVPQ